MDTRRKVNTERDERKKKEFGIEREITDPTSSKLLVHIFPQAFIPHYSCSNQPGLKLQMKTGEGWASGCWRHGECGKLYFRNEAISQ